MSKEDKETIDDYTNDTKQLVALLQSNSWIATNGEKSIDFGDNTITVIDPGSSKSNSKPKSFVIQSMTQETEDGTGNEIYNCSIEINGKSHLLMVNQAEKFFGYHRRDQPFRYRSQSVRARSIRK